MKSAAGAAATPDSRGPVVASAAATPDSRGPVVASAAASITPPPRRYVPGTGWKAKVPQSFAWLCYVTALVSLASALLPGARHWFGTVSELLSWIFLSAPPSLAWAALMVILGTALAKRKRAAWGFLIFLKFVGIALNLLLLVLAFIPPQTSYVPMLVKLVIDLAFLGLLVSSNREFFARVQKGNDWRALITFITGLAISVAIGSLILLLSGSALDRVEQMLNILNQFIESIGSSATFTHVERLPRAFSLFVGVLGALTFIASAIVFYRPRRKDLLITPEAEVKIRGLLLDYGEADSLGYFATRRDKSAMFAPNGQAVVTYRVLLGTSLASADPIGDQTHWPAAIEAWLEEARQFGWAPAVGGSSAAGAEAYRTAGLHSMELGDEAVLNFHDFQLGGRQMRAVRQAVHRVQRAGYTARVRRHSDVPAAEMRLARSAADKWRDAENERGFSMAIGRLGDPCDGHCVLVEAFDVTGELQGLLSFSPWGDKGLSLDLMRRAKDSENGVMEFMITALVDAGPKIGVDQISLNFAVMRGIFEEGERLGAGPIIKLTRGFLLFASRWWQLESLYRSNDKYDPIWVRRYLQFEKIGDLPRVSLAYAAAEGFLPIPSLSNWWRHRHQHQAETSPLAAACANSPVELWLAEEHRREAAAAAEAAVAAAAAATDPFAGLPEQEKVRRRKLTELRAAGFDPYSGGFKPSTDIGAARERFAGLGVDERTSQTVSVAGRLMLNRVTGKIAFAVIRDWSGEIQVMLSLRDCGESALTRWKQLVDLGDLVGVTGEVITSKRGELSVLAASFEVTAKCLVPLPDKHKGLTDPEARVRQRYVDLIVNPQAREMLVMRSKLERCIREFLWSQDYLEVETPMLQAVHGGANARPFVTHINAYDMRLYLRIAPELYLKRLLVGGVSRVFELNRNFRNEGADSTHNPEFTSLEMYDAYGDYEAMRVLTRELIVKAAIAVHGRPIALRPVLDIPRADAGVGASEVADAGLGASDAGLELEEVDISGEWPVVSVYAAVSAVVGETVTPDTEKEKLIRLCERFEIARGADSTAGALVTALYEDLVESSTTMPTFYRDFPVETSPLTRKKPADPRLAERWDLVAWGAELATAYTELTDPIDQRERLTRQSSLAAAGDPEAMELDEDFLRALEYGMPPAGGQGMGIDRLLMLLTGKNIRDTVLFPLTKLDT